MESAANYNMRALLIIVLICAAFADDAVHYPTNHPGVCNILAFVSDHVDEVVDMAHDEIEAVTDKSSDNSTALVNAIERIKRQVKDMEQVAQCLATDLIKQDTLQNPQEIPLATSEVPEQKITPQEVQRSVRDVFHLLETYTTNKPQSDLTQTSDQPQQLIQHVVETNQPQQVLPHVAGTDVLQHVAGTQDAKRLVRDVVHLLTNISALAAQTDKEVKQKETNGNSSIPAVDILQPSPQHVASTENTLRQIRDVVHLLGSFVQNTDATQQITLKESAGNVEEPIPPKFEQHDASQERQRRNAVKAIEDEITQVFKKLDTKTADDLQQDLKQDYFLRTARDVAHILGTQSPCHLENEVKQEINLQNSKIDYFQTVDILPEETQYVAVQETGGYADQLFPPTIGQPADFQERLRRNAVNIIEDDGNIPPKDSQHVASAETSPRLVRDVVHLQDTYTTLASNQGKQASTIQQAIDVSPQATQHVAKQQSEENIKENLSATTEQNTGALNKNNKQVITSDIAPTVSLPTIEVSQQAVQHVAAQENYGSIEKPKVLNNRRKRNVEQTTSAPIKNKTLGITSDNAPTVSLSTIEVPEQALQHVAAQENDASVEKRTVLNNRRKRNVEIGRKSPAYITKQQNDGLKKKSRRSPDELQVPLNHISQQEHNLNNQAIPLKEPQENKYIQIVKRRASDKRTRRSDDIILKDQTKPSVDPNDLTQKNSHDDDRVVGIVSSTRVARSSTVSLKNPEEVPAQLTVEDVNSLIGSSDDSSNIPSSTSTQNPTDSQEDVREFLKPTVKVQHPPLPLTQFARRNTIKKVR